MHPHDAVGFGDVARTGLERLLAQPRVVAVGECGLDFYRDLAPARRPARGVRRAARPGAQRPASRSACTAARPAARPSPCSPSTPSGLRVILHCFSTPEYVELCNERGYFVSFAGNLTYKSSGDLRTAAAAVRDDLLLVETDAPFLTPMPYRGHANRPAYVALTAQFLARLRGWSDDEVAAVTSANARRAFAIDAPAAPPTLVSAAHARPPARRRYGQHHLVDRGTLEAILAMARVHARRRRARGRRRPTAC